MFEKAKSFALRYGSAVVLGALIGHFDTKLLSAFVALLQTWTG